MLYAASVKVTFKKSQRRIDLIVEAEDPEQAEEKAIKQAKKIYSPGKKASYVIVTIVSETEAINSLSQPNET